jgi:hypothetical protein
MQADAKGDRHRSGWVDLGAERGGLVFSVCFWRCSLEHDVGRYYSVFFQGFKRVGWMNPQAPMTNGTNNNPTTSNLMPIVRWMCVLQSRSDAGPPLIPHIGWIPGSFSDG